MIDEVSPQKLEPFEVPAEEHSIVLISLLESLDGLSSYGLNLLLSSQELLVLFKVSYRSALRSSLRVLAFSLAILASFIAVIKSFFNFEFSAPKAATRDTTDLTLAS